MKLNLSRIYRPSKWEEFYGNKFIVKDLQNYVKTNDPPHMLFYGPRGCGKNTLAYIFATNYLGRKISINTGENDPDYKEMNASDERGIDVVRDVIKIFAKTRSLTPNKKRIIVLDEADNLTQPAQMALRSIMEKNEHRCIFILILNHLEGIKEPALLSRCAIFKFQPPSFDDQVKFIKKISEKEGIEFEAEEMIKAIATYYKGDMRAILVDCIEALRGKKEPINPDDLHKVYEGYDIRKMMREIDESEHPKWVFYHRYKKENIDVRKFLEKYFEFIGQHHSKIFAEVDARLRDGASTIIQMSYLFDSIAEVKD